MTIDTILENIAEYANDIDTLVKSLKELGINSLEDLKAEARAASVGIPHNIQKAVEDKFLHADDDDWAEAEAQNTIEAYENYLDTHPDGAYREQARDAMVKLMKQQEAAGVASEWQQLDKSNMDSLQEFIDKYPDSEYKEEATNILRQLRKDKYTGVGIKALVRQMNDIKTDVSINNPELAIYEKIAEFIRNGKISKEELLEALRKNHNLISGRVAYLLWDNAIISDFEEAGIEPEFIEYMMSGKRQKDFKRPEPLTKITKVPCTEVYFWGIPSSGKSCALGAIMSAANDGHTALSMAKDNQCQGYDYMNRLSVLFKTNGDVSSLPPGTPTTSTYEMGFELEDEDHRIHPITCIDLAGELMRCMYKHDAGEPMDNDQKDVLKMLTDVLKDNSTSNRKMHFFVLEYGAEDRLYEGLPQSEYLQAAVAYIQRTGIFQKDTDGIYMLITKVDKAGVTGMMLREVLKEYVSNHYQGFYNGLKRICKENEINEGKVDILPFTLGQVCFQNYCKFDSKTASQVVKLILDRGYGYKQGRFHRIINALKN